jgi:hypothetical protein
LRDILLGLWIGNEKHSSELGDDNEVGGQTLAPSFRKRQILTVQIDWLIQAVTLNLPS